MPSTAQPHIIDVPPLSVRADVSSVDVERRTAELIFATGSPVTRYDWLSDKRYIEKLSLDPKHVRIERLDAAGPLLNAHSGWSLSDQIGIVEPGSIKVTGKEARATVRFSRRAEVEPIFQDVRDGIYKSVSVGYRVHKFEEEQGKGNALPVRTAVDWEPFEVSLVPMPADVGARVRADKARTDTNQCVVVPSEAAKKDADRSRQLLLVRSRSRSCTFPGHAGS